MKKLKLKTRKGIPETNSSSTHSLSMGSLLDRYSPEEITDLVLDSDGSLTIDLSSGWNFAGNNTIATSDTYTKLVYVTELFRKFKGPKDLKRLERVIKDFTGASCLKIIPSNISIIDTGNSNSKYILESYDSISNFLFNPTSYLFNTSDETELEKARRTVLEADETAAVVKFNFGDDIGPIDFEILKFPNSIQGILEELHNDNLRNGKDVLSLNDIFLIHYKSMNKTFIRNISTLDNDTINSSDTIFLTCGDLYKLINPKSILFNNKPAVLYLSRELLNKLISPYRTSELSVPRIPKEEEVDNFINSIHSAIDDPINNGHFQIVYLEIESKEFGKL